MALTFKLARLERPVVPFLGIAVLAFAATGLEPSDTSWSLAIPTPAVGNHVVYARANQGFETGSTASRSFTVTK